MIISIFSVGCIKEDRDVCPCRLLLDFDGVDTSVTQSVVLSVKAEGMEHRDEIELPVDEAYHVEVPRSEVGICIWAGAGHCLNHDMSLTIPYGEDAPRAYLQVSSTIAEGELVSETVKLGKEHCVMTVDVVDGFDHPYKISVKGCICGYSDTQGPVKGDFFYETAPGITNSCQIVLPRQLDSSLVLELDDGVGPVRSFPIGKMLDSEGYDWTAADLDDVSVRLDYATTEIILRIIGWDEENIYEIII